MYIKRNFFIIHLFGDAKNRLPITQPKKNYAQSDIKQTSYPLKECQVEVTLDNALVRPELITVLPNLKKLFVNSFFLFYIALKKYHIN